MNMDLARKPTPATPAVPATAASEEVEAVVERVDDIASGIRLITLSAREGGALPRWEPGAHVDLLLDAHLERQYSLCGKPEDAHHWQVAVLRDTSSRGGSEWLHTRLRAGDVLRARTPRNNFPLVDAENHIFVAGGIGITPLLPMIRQLERQGKPWHLLYVGRTLASMAFVDELSAYGSRATISAKDRDGPFDLKQLLGTPQANTVVYCCGPERLIAGVESACAAWPADTLHVEHFRAKSGALDGDKDAFEVYLTKAGISVPIRAGQSILDALDQVDIYVPRSCNEGTCGTCVVKVADGIPDHRDSFLMGKKRRENKHVCLCCSRSLTPVLALEL